MRPASNSADRRWASASHSADGCGHSSGGTSSQSASANRMRSAALRVRAAASTSVRVGMFISSFKGSFSLRRLGGSRITNGSLAHFTRSQSTRQAWAVIPYRGAAWQSGSTVKKERLEYRLCQAAIAEHSSRRSNRKLFRTTPIAIVQTDGTIVGEGRSTSSWPLSISTYGWSFSTPRLCAREEKTLGTIAQASFCQGVAPSKCFFLQRGLCEKKHFSRSM